MSRGGETFTKRQRQAEKARKRRDKLERRWRKRDEAPAPVEIVSAADIAGDLPPIEEAFEAVEAEIGVGGSGSGAGSTPTVPMRLFVGGLSWGTTEKQLVQAFSEYGNVLEAVVVLDRETGKSRGFGFVTMEDKRDANKAMRALTDTELDGRTIVVNAANDR
jgi:RNA recognition motif-containing protein